MNQAYLRHDADLLRERRAAYRPRLHLDRVRRAGALQAARRVRRVLPDRHRRARPEGREGGAPTPGSTRRAFTDQVSADFRDMADDDGHLATTTSSAPRRSGTSASCAELWRRIAASGRHLSRPLRGLVRGSRRGVLRRGRADHAGRTAARWRRPARRSSGCEEPSYFFRLSAWQDRLLKFYEDHPDFIAARPARRNEVLSFVRGGLRDLSISRTSFTWGIPVPDAPGARDVCLARRADQLHHRLRLPRRRRRRAGASGRPTCTWSARTSCASTRSTGRPS